MTILGPIRSSPSSVESWSLKSQYALAICGVCLLWCGHPLLSELVDCAKNGVFPGGILEFGYPGLAEGNVIDSHIQFDFPRSL